MVTTTCVLTLEADIDDNYLYVDIIELLLLTSVELTLDVTDATLESSYFLEGFPLSLTERGKVLV